MLIKIEMMRDVLLGLAIIVSFSAQAQTEIINKVNLQTGQQEQLEIIKEGLLLYTRFYADGSVDERGFLMNGKRHGLWQKFAQSGNKQSEISFNQGLREGLKYVWDSDGRLIYKVRFEEGRIVEAIQYSGNGSIIASR